MNWIFVSLAAIYGLIRVLRYQHGVAFGFKIDTADIAKTRIVFRQQNRFVSSQRFFTLHNLFLSGSRVQARQVNRETASSSNFAVNPNKPVALLHDPVHGRQPESGSLPLILGRKEWLEDPQLGFGAHSDPRVGHRQSHVTAGRDSLTV